MHLINDALITAAIKFGGRSLGVVVCQLARQLYAVNDATGAS